MAKGQRDPIERRRTNKRCYKKNKESILSRQKAYYEKNKAKINAQCAAYYRKNKEKCAAKKASRLYNITPEQVLRLREIKVCTLCAKEVEGKTQHIDHCHKTGRIRGILCNNCNGLLGLMEKSLDRGVDPMQIFNYIESAEVNLE